MPTGDWFKEMGGGGDAWNNSPQEGWLAAGTAAPAAAPAPTQGPGWGTGHGSQGGGSFASMVDEAIEETRRDYVPSATGSVYAEAGGTVPVDDELLLPVQRSAKGNPFIWAVVTLLFLLVGAGVWFVLHRSAAPPSPSSQRDPSAAPQGDIDYFKSGLEAFNAKDYEKAANDMTIALAWLKREPARAGDALRAREVMAYSQLKMRQYKEAEELYRGLVQAFPKEDKYRQLLAETRAAKVKANRDEGSKVLKQANLAWSDGEVSQALSLAQQALKLFEDNQGTNAQRAQANALIGQCYLALGNSSKAAAHLRKAVGYDPSNKDYPAWLDQAGAQMGVYTAPTRPAAPEEAAPERPVPSGHAYPTGRKKPRAPRSSGAPAASAPAAAADPQAQPARKPPPPPPRVSSNSNKRRGGIPRDDDVLPSYRNSGSGSRLKTY